MNFREPAQLALVATGSMASGIAGQWIMLTAIGPGADTDAYFAALVLPQVLLAIAAGPLLNVLVPLLANEPAAERPDIVRALLTNLGGAGALLSLLLIVIAPLLVRIVAPGFSADQNELAAALIRIQILVFALSVPWLVLSAATQSSGGFLRVEGATLVGSLVGLTVIIAAVPAFGVTAAAWAGVARVVVQGLLLLPQHGLPFRQRRPASELTRHIWHLMRPLLLSGTLAKMDPIVDRALLSLTIGGALSLFQLAQGLLAAVIDIFARALIIPTLPSLARSAVADPPAFLSQVRQLLLQTAALIAVGCIGFAAVGEELLHLALEHGRMSAEAVGQLWWLLLGLAGYLIGATLGQIGATGFYARGDTATPARLSVLSFLCFAPMKIAAFGYFGLPGLVGACSAYYMTNALALLFFLNRGLNRSS